MRNIKYTVDEIRNIFMKLSRPVEKRQTTPVGIANPRLKTTALKHQKF